MYFQPTAEPTPGPTAESPLDDVLARQYNRWPYPNPTRDLVDYARTGRDIADPALCHGQFWPDRDYPHGLDILVAGCGSNQGADIAFHNRSARVLGIDVSEASLSNERYLRDKHQLTNLELLRLPIEEIETLGRDFDLIISTGVLHHMADPQLGMNVLARCLRRDGVAAIYLYGRYGRIGIEIMQDLFLRRLRLPQDEAGIAFVRGTLELLPREHPMKAILPRVVDIDFDGGVVDELLGARERSYTVEECLDFVAKAGLVFQGWGENAFYHPEAGLNPATDLCKRLSALPVPELWSATDLVACNPGHFFMACRPDRPKSQYVIDFADPEFLAYRPVARPGVQVRQPDRAAGRPARLKRGWLEVPINDTQALVLNHVDGRRDIRAIVDAVMAAGLTGPRGEVESFVKGVFKSLWRLGLVLVRLPAA